MGLFTNFKQGNIIISTFYFLMYGGAACFLAFYNIYLEEQGFSGIKIGTIMAVFQAVLVFAVVFWGILADKRGIKKIVILASGFTAVLVILLPFINQFVLLILFMMVFAFFYHPTPSLIDTISIHHIKQYEAGSFGKYRLWGSVGWGTASLIIGILVSYFDIALIFPATAVFLGLIILLTSLYVKNDRKRDSENLVSLKSFKAVFTNIRLSLFFIIIFFYGVSKAPLTYFINLYFKEIGASNSLVGIAFTVQAFCELPFFFYADKLVRKFGPKKVIIFTILFTTVRLFLYSRIMNPYLAIPLGAGHGITLGLFIVASTHYVQNLVPLHWRATAQSLIWGFHFGAGVTVGNLLIGYLKDKITMVGVMFWESVATFAVLLIMSVYFLQTSDKRVVIPQKNK